MTLVDNLYDRGLLIIRGPSEQISLNTFSRYSLNVSEFASEVEWNTWKAGMA